MGYTHYFEKFGYTEISEAEKENIVKDVKKVFQYIKKHFMTIDGEPLIINGESYKYAVANKNFILFNGTDKLPTKTEFENRNESELSQLSHETFYFDFSQKQFNGFCKTARKPYDIVVCCVLIILKEHLGYKFKFSSDGEYNNDEWLKAIELYNNVFNEYLIVKNSIGNETAIVKN